jgi:DNA-binding NarL/FixJ family response regulator
LHASGKLAVMRSPPPIRVLLAAQHRVLLRGLRSVLADPTQFTIVAAVQTADALPQQVATTPFDVLVIDPADLGGLALLARLVPAYPRRVLVFAGLLDLRADLLAVGARGYVCQQDPPEDLRTGIRRVARRQVYRSPIADECWQYYLAHGPRGMTPRQTQALGKERGDE